MEQEFDPERLRPLLHIAAPDPRSTMWVRIDREAGTSRTIELRDHHEEISRLVLHAGVPEDVLLQFETVRNVYLYAWFVYRFYPVAEHHSFACLELALRNRFKEDIQAGKLKFRGPQPMLSALLKYAVDQGIVRNEGFEVWRNRGEINSRARVEMEKLQEMSEKNLTEMTWDDSDIQVTAEDLDWDYAHMLVDVLPQLRNGYAHGSTNLHNQALSTIQIVCEIINQLYDCRQKSGVVTRDQSP